VNVASNNALPWPMRGDAIWRAFAWVALTSCAATGSTCYAQSGRDSSGSEIGIPSLLSSPALAAEVQRQRQQNALAVGSLKWDDFTKSTTVASKLNELGGELHFGTHNVASRDGEKLVWLIRSTASGDVATRSANLTALTDYANAGVPEAMTFMGVVAQYGLFGTQKDAARAHSLYAAAAKSRYQPALYDLGLESAYGRGTRVDFNQAAQFFVSAAALGPDLSARLCGLGAFVSFRLGDQTQALQFAHGCGSPLAALPVARANTGALTAHDLEDLRRSTATGVDDALALIERAARAGATNDPQYLYCKYALVARYRRASTTEGLRADAQACVDSTSRSSGAPPPQSADQMRREQAVLSVAGFVPTEIASLAAMRKSNHFHYDWSVPYLPFTQQDANLFEPLMGQ
jgi:TPR repeat protein